MIALDATYSVGDNLSGVGVYSRELLHGLAAQGSEWEWFYRHKAFPRAGPLPSNIRKRLLLERWGSRSASLFHGLNQRLPLRRFKRQIATFHDLFVLTAEYSTPEFRERFARQARHAAESADMIIAVSQFTANQVEEHLGVPSSHIHVIHHGIVPRRIPQLNREKIVLCVGAIQARKNQVRLVEAFSVLPAPWKLVLAGGEGFEARRTLEAIRQSSAAERIIITGYLSESELSKWYARASIFAFPSLDEGFGMPVLEAMSAGIPVIVSSCSALQEVSGDAALQIDPRNTRSIADALEQLATNASLRDQYVEKGRNRAAEFSWHKAVTATIQIYRKLI